MVVLYSASACSCGDSDRLLAFAHCLLYAAFKMNGFSTNEKNRTVNNKTILVFVRYTLQWQGVWSVIFEIRGPADCRPGLFDMTLYYMNGESLLRGMIQSDRMIAASRCSNTRSAVYILYSMSCEQFALVTLVVADKRK